MIGNQDSINLDIQNYLNDYAVQMRNNDVAEQNIAQNEVNNQESSNTIAVKADENRYEETKEPDDYIIHKPPHIIIHRPPTEILLHHAPIYIKRAPIIYERPGNIIKRKIERQMMPRQVIVKPVYYRVIKPIEKRVLVNPQMQYYSPNLNMINGNQ